MAKSKVWDNYNNFFENKDLFNDDIIILWEGHRYYTVFLDKAANRLGLAIQMDDTHNYGIYLPNTDPYDLQLIWLSHTAEEAGYTMEDIKS